MKKILLLFSSLGIGSSAILSSTSSIKQETQIENFKYHNENITNVKNKDGIGDINLFLTDLTFKNTSIDKGGDGTFYDDEIFLLSIKQPTSSQYGLGNYNTSIELNSSEKNLEETQSKLLASNKISLRDANLNKQEYEKIANIKDGNGSSKIDTTVGVVNRYLSNGLLSYNPNGFISSREDILNGTKESQSRIVFNSSLSATKLGAVSDYISFGLHLTHIDITLRPALMNNFIINLLNKGLIYVMDKGLSKSIAEAADAMGKAAMEFVEDILQELLAMINIDLSAFPELILFLVPIGELITWVISSWIGNEIRKLIIDAVAPGLESLIRHALFKIDGKELNSNLPSLKFSLGLALQLGITSKPVSFEKEDVQSVPWTVLTPSLPDNKLNTQGTLTGTGKNCVLYMQSDNFKMFLNAGDPLDSLKSLNIENKFVTLTNEDWSKITDKIYYDTSYIVPGNGKAVIIDIINGQLTYTNITKDHYNDLSVANLGYLMSTFSGSNNSSNLIITPNQIQDLFNVYNYINFKPKNGKSIWEQIKKDEHPKEDNPTDYFYDKYISNFLQKSNIDKEIIINNFKNLQNSNLNFINMTSESKDTILNINFNINNKITFNN